MALPMDAQGGENIEAMQSLYGALLKDARERGLLNDQYYFLSESVLGIFKRFQGFGADTQFDGFRLEQAHTIWSAAPQELFKALFKSMFAERGKQGRV